jgi:CPA1 family monovalent cation:H+ antiporter
LFEFLLVLVVAALTLAAIARHMQAPYPSMLAIGGVALAFIPGIPRLTIDPDLVLALFVAPALLDAAYDTSIRDIKRDWAALTGLAVGAVIATTIAVAFVARLLVPDMPWPVAIALGAIVAPTDAIAATVVLRQLAPPHRLITILEGEGLFNDATALIIYRVAIGALVVGAFEPASLAFAFLIGVVGGLVLGVLCGKLSMWLMARVEDLPSAIIMQFVGTFAVWIFAERIGVSAVLTLVAYAMTIARTAPIRSSARHRLPSYAVWEVVVFLLNVMAFSLIGLQLRPLVETFSLARDGFSLVFAGAIFATVVALRFIWVYLFMAGRRLVESALGRRDMVPGSLARNGLIIVWSGMRGVITIATAIALPIDPQVFPYRNLVVLSAFAVVLASLVIQGLTLRPIMLALDLSDDDPVGQESARARRRAWQAAIDSLEGETSDAAEAVRSEYRSQIEANDKDDLAEPMVASDHARLRRQAVMAARQTVLAMRQSAEIGDDAFHVVEAELDVIEIGVPE